MSLYSQCKLFLFLLYFIFLQLRLVEGDKNVSISIQTLLSQSPSPNPPEEASGIRTELLFKALVSIVLQNTRAECQTIILTSTKNSSESLSRVQHDLGTAIKPATLIDLTFCQIHASCSLSLSFRKTTCFTLLVEVRNASTLPTITRQIRLLFIPGSLNRGKYVFFNTEELQFKPKLLQHPSLDFFKYKLEISHGFNGRRQPRLLFHTYSSLNTKTYAILGGYSGEKEGIRLIRDSLFPDLTLDPHTTSFNYTLVQAFASKSPITSRAKEYSPPMYQFVSDVASLYNWTLEKTYFEPQTQFKDGYLDRLKQFKRAVGLSAIVSERALRAVDLSHPYHFAKLYLLERIEPDPTTFDTAVRILQSTYPGLSYAIIISIISSFVTVGSLLGPWILNFHRRGRRGGSRIYRWRSRAIQLM
jgi:hypothetical protein